MIGRTASSKAWSPDRSPVDIYIDELIYDVLDRMHAIGARTQMKRAITVLKARGSNNSSTVSEFNISADGITLGGPVDVRALRD